LKCLKIFYKSLLQTQLFCIAQLKKVLIVNNSNFKFIGKILERSRNILTEGKDGILKMSVGLLLLIAKTFRFQAFLCPNFLIFLHRVAEGGS